MSQVTDITAVIEHERRKLIADLVKLGAISLHYSCGFETDPNDPNKEVWVEENQLQCHSCGCCGQANPDTPDSLNDLVIEVTNDLYPSDHPIKRKEVSS